MSLDDIDRNDRFSQIIAVREEGNTFDTIYALDGVKCWKSFPYSWSKLRKGKPYR